MKKFILLAAAAIALTACNTEDNNIDDPVAAQISAVIGDNSLSRATDVKWDNGDKIGVSMGDRYLNILYTTENGDGAFKGSAIYFRNKQEPVTLSAYYPYSGTEDKAPAVISASTDGERQNADEQPKFDFLYDVKENVTGANPNVNFTFKHRMSKLTFTFENGNDGTDVSKISTCEINGLVLDGTFNPVTGECAAKAGSSASPLVINPKVVNATQLPSLILFPQSVSNVTMKITDSENQKYSCVLKFDGNRLESGNNYTYTIKVNKTKLEIEKYSIEPWHEIQGVYPAKSE